MRRLFPLVLSLAIGGCTTTQIMSSGDTAAIAPTLSVERFLQSANSRDLHSMARMFGTADGPIIDTGGPVGCAFKRVGSWIGLGERCMTIQEVELQMDAIAMILRHDDYTVVSEQAVAGRKNPTSRVGVDLWVNGEEKTDVPFFVVKTSRGQWLVEEIDLTKITG